MPKYIVMQHAYPDQYLDPSLNKVNFVLELKTKLL